MPVSLGYFSRFFNEAEYRRNRINAAMNISLSVCSIGALMFLASRDSQLDFLKSIARPLWFVGFSTSSLLLALDLIFSLPAIYLDLKNKFAGIAAGIISMVELLWSDSFRAFLNLNPVLIISRHLLETRIEFFLGPVDFLMNALQVNRHLVSDYLSESLQKARQALAEKTPKDFALLAFSCVLALLAAQPRQVNTFEIRAASSIATVVLVAIHAGILLAEMRRALLAFRAPAGATSSGATALILRSSETAIVSSHQAAGPLALARFPVTRRAAAPVLLLKNYAENPAPAGGRAVSPELN